MSILSNNTSQLQQIIEVLNIKIDNVVGTWVFNNQLNLTGRIETYFNFTSYDANGVKRAFTGLRIGVMSLTETTVEDYSVEYLTSEGTSFTVCDTLVDMWENEMSRTIEILEEPDTEFGTWLKANAIRRGLTSATPGLPTLTNPGTSADLLVGKQLIDSNGNIVEGEALSFDEGYERGYEYGHYEGYDAGYMDANKIAPTITVSQAGIIKASVGSKSTTTILSSAYDSDFKAENIKKDVIIFGTKGTLEVADTASVVKDYAPLLIQLRSTEEATSGQVGGGSLAYNANDFIDANVNGVTYNWSDDIACIFTESGLSLATQNLKITNMNKYSTVKLYAKAFGIYQATNTSGMISSGNVEKVVISEILPGETVTELIRFTDAPANITKMSCKLTPYHMRWTYHITT